MISLYLPFAARLPRLMFAPFSMVSPEARQIVTAITICGPLAVANWRQGYGVYNDPGSTLPASI